jgi:hypothetical protein
MITPKDKVANDGLPGPDQLILIHRLPIWRAEGLWLSYKRRLAPLADVEQHQSRILKRHSPQ